jgi:tRNA-splicing ligase RtcB (3'-phosphate/5'-hydroxy nucleic acid ligase)
MPIAQQIDAGGVPVKVWTPELEPQARRQLENVSRLPIVHGHIAAMPDVHAGIGATVGSVIPTKGAIVPAAVGVDIGCFTGDTEVILADSKRHRLEDLAARGGPFHVYACTPEGRVKCATAYARQTRSDAELVEVELDNGELIRCTPDHRFMLRDGNYSEAGKLQPGTSLMPFYSSFDSEGYLRVLQPNSGKPQRAHWLVARSGLLGEIPDFEGQRTVIHHENFDEADNTPSNLIFMGDKTHSSLHRLLVERNVWWHATEFEAARKAALRRKAETPEGHAYFAARGTANLKRYMANRRDHFLASVAGNGARGKQSLERYNTSDEGRAKSREIANRIHSCPECGAQVRSPIGLFNHRKGKHGVLANHKVVSVRRLAERENVYCMSVPGLENFALAAGVFVHNCGMNAVQLSLSAKDLPESLGRIRSAIESSVPTGFDMHASAKGRGGSREKKAKELASGLEHIVSRNPRIGSMQKDFRETWIRQLGTLGGGNHFIELCLDEAQNVWVMLHSGSRGIGNVIGRYFIERARREMEKCDTQLPDRDLAWLAEGSPAFEEYVDAVHWAQDYAIENRREMMRAVLAAIEPHLPKFRIVGEAINCHHNYVARERHFGENLLVTRKGAIRAGQGDMGIIPGSMGARSFIVRGKGNPESLCSCAHGAGRLMSRTEAKKRFSVEDVKRQTAGVECRKDAGVVDEIPGAYKSIDEVMENQSDLVEVVHTLKQVLCVKG